MRLEFPLIAAFLLVALPASAGSGEVLLAWTPAPSLDPVVYEVYGVVDDVETFLGSTQENHFFAPDGYPAYAVRHSSHQAGEVCVTIRGDGTVDVDFSC